MPSPNVPPRPSDGPDISVEPLRYNAGDLIAEKYRLQELMGKGGMGSVWRAQNLALGVDVAVKLIHGELASPEMTERLQREAQAAARLEHPSAVRVFDLGESELGDPFIVMELLRGESLRDVLDRRTKIPQAELVPLLLPVASALAAAHQKGIVHRDLKPENIVITEHEGHPIPKVVDFGLAKVESSKFDRRSTREGTIMGSPDYMAPEQARGDVSRMDARTDIWSLGVVIYEALAGRTPFAADHPLALLRAIIEDEPPSLESLGAADAQLSAIISRALEKAPSARWADMRAFGRALAEWAIATGIDTDATGSSIAAHWTRGSRGSLASDETVAPSSVQVVPLFVDDKKTVAGLSAPSSQSAGEAPSNVWTASGRPRKRRWVPFAIGIGAVLCAGAAVAGLRGGLHANDTSAPQTPAPRPKPATAPATSASVSAPAVLSSVPSATVSTSSSASATASALPSASAPAASSTEVSACIGRIFPDDAFEADAQLGKVCAEPDPRKAASLLRSEIARHGLILKRTTEAMRVWSLLSWYELPTVSLARGACCPASNLAATELPASVGTCPPIGPVLDEIERNAHGKVTDPMVRDFRTAALCIDRGQRINPGMESPFPYDGPPGGGAESAFRRLLDRTH